jgi:hypothetical protein
VENSDIDILILMKNLKNERKTTGLLYRLVYPPLPTTMYDIRRARERRQTS